MNFTIYTTTTCPYCKMLKDYLNSKNIAFTEKFVDSDETARNEMMAKSNGFLGVPFSVVVNDAGLEAVVVGFDKGKINSHLGISE